MKQTSNRSSRHLKFDWNLVDEHGKVRGFSDEEFDDIHKALPIIAASILLTTKEPTAQLITVGGLPAFFNKHAPVPSGQRGMGDAVFREDRLAGILTAPPDTLIRRLWLLVEKSTEVRYILWTPSKWVMWVEEYSHDLPSFAGWIRVEYITSKGPAARASASRHQIPAIESSDINSYYPTVRPGAAVAGAKSSVCLGMAVEPSSGGAPLVTASAHGLDGIGSEVFHPAFEKKVIGQVVQQIPHTDIVLLKLSPGVTLDPQLYKCHDPDEIFPPPSRLSHLISRPERGLRVGTVVFNVNAFNGWCEGTYQGQGKRALPAGVGSSAVWWIDESWAYFECGARGLLDGARGSPVLTGDGGVVGFFQLQTEDGLSIAIGASNLTDEGFQHCK